MQARIWVDQIILPTYPVGKPNKNPLFLEKRVYQGSSGKIYPYPFTDKIEDEKIDQTYDVVYLENDYLLVMIMPAMGGKIYRAIDKTNQYDFVYYNEVVKPALVGLTGPWVSGGIEFNWPQHHRPSTFEPVDYILLENEDGSKTCWVSEIDKMNGTKGMAGFTVYPDKAYIEVKGQLYNRTELPQTFLWWANPAVAVNDDTKSIFPPDVHAVFDHGKRDVSTFPIATGTYYKMDYSKGVDISRYKNIPVPTSYMADHSDYNFVGGYDYGVEAGLMHVANHHVSPGKKQWTWGNGDFGQAWDRNLTDNNGPYIELMIGMYADNQPDFTWLAPKEEKTFKQYFMPYKDIGEVKNATKDILMNIDIDQEHRLATVKLYVTSVTKNLYVKLFEQDKIVNEWKVTEASPLASVTLTTRLEVVSELHHYHVDVLDVVGQNLLSYEFTKTEVLAVPDPAKPALLPADIETCEQLFLTGQHLEQYRHATYEPTDYYIEALKRDPSDYRCNNALGLLLYRRGQFAEAISYLKKATQTVLQRNPNPYDGEALYNLGLAYKKVGAFDLAYNVLYKSVWSGAWQAAGYYEIALLDCMNKDWNAALEHVELALIRNVHNMKGRLLKGALLRRLGRQKASEKYIEETLTIDCLDFGAYFEKILLSKTSSMMDDAKLKFKKVMRNQANNYLELARDYGDGGLYEEAVRVLEIIVDANEDKTNVDPMIYYYMIYYKRRMGQEVSEVMEMAKEAKPDYCFPNHLMSQVVLEESVVLDPEDSKAHHYLGNLYFDKKQYEKAMRMWETSTKLDPTYATSHRNLALAIINKQGDLETGKQLLEKAFSLEDTDARILFELDQLYKKMNTDDLFRLALLEKYSGLVHERDDLMVEYLNLLNYQERFTEVEAIITMRQFHPWEGGEGKVSGVYKRCRIEQAKKVIFSMPTKALELLESCLTFPHNLGEGKLYGAAENDIYYYMGLAYRQLTKDSAANEAFLEASVGLEEPTDAMFYNDQPADMIFYQGLALTALGNTVAAEQKFDKLITYGEAHQYDVKRIDYFAVSLPDFLVFEEDLSLKNLVHCNYLMGLGWLGKGKKELATQYFDKAAQLNRNHLGVRTHQQFPEKLFIN